MSSIFLGTPSGKYYIIRHRASPADGIEPAEALVNDKNDIIGWRLLPNLNIKKYQLWYQAWKVTIHETPIRLQSSNDEDAAREFKIYMKTNWKIEVIIY